MPFWLHEHRLVCCVKSISLKSRVIGTIILISVLSLAWFAFLYRPMLCALERQQQAYQLLETQYNLFAKTAQRYEVVRQEHDKLATQLRQKMVNMGSTQQMISSLVGMFHSCGMSCRGIRPREVVKRDGYQIQPFAVRGKGTFNQLLMLLRTLHKHPASLQCRTLSIAKGNNNRLTMQMDIEVVQLKEIVGS